MTGVRKAALIVAILAIGGALVYVNLSFERATGPEVEVEAVERRSLEAIVSASGTIVPQLTVDISADTMGRVTRLEFNEGDRVKRGQFLLEIDPESLRSAVDRGEAALRASRSSQRQLEVAVETARVTLDLARDNLERQENLWELRLVSRETYEQAVTDVALRETELRAREVDVATQIERISQEVANLESARYELTKVTITSPFAGVVTRRNIEAGETVVVGTMNNAGTVLATIADLSVIEAEVEVDETDIPSIELGQWTEVTIDALPDRSFSGIVTEIGNSPIQATQQGAGTQATTFKVVVTLDDEIPSVRPGFTCTADITTAVRSDTLSIPIQATTVREMVVDTHGKMVREESEPRRRRDNQPAGSSEELPPGFSEEELEGIFVARQGRAVFLPVETGIAGERYFEALSGVEVGDLVITGPFSEVRNLEDGDAIRVVDSASSR
ncbi:MAG: efflux RND transporter periplasmic adaptor subunit [Vicinamibacterales bacterium]|nr:efflux RND transporter periplasmic adaptor subunit [Vicinamibacterales bacterium]